MKGLEASRTTSTHHVSARATQRPHFRCRNQGMKTVRDHPCVREPGGSRAHMKYIAASTIILSALLPGTAVHQLHAQDEEIFTWPGEVETSTSTLTIREGETVSYMVRLTEQPVVNDWWLFVQVDGVVYHDGAFCKDTIDTKVVTIPCDLGEAVTDPDCKDGMGPAMTCPWIRWTPSVGWDIDRAQGSPDPDPEMPNPTEWRTVSITAPHDADADDEFLTFTHEVWDETTACPDDLHAVAPVTVHIIDDEAPATGVTLSVSEDEVGEGAGATTLTVTGTLNGGAFTEDTTVELSVSAGTATETDDYTAETETLTIDAGETTGTTMVTLTPVGDDVDEDDETVTVGGTATDLTVKGTTVTIIDDDERGVAVSTTVCHGQRGRQRGLHGGAQVAADGDGDGRDLGDGRRGRDGAADESDVHGGQLEHGANGGGERGARRRRGRRRRDGGPHGERRRLRRQRCDGRGRDGDDHRQRRARGRCHADEAVVQRGRQRRIRGRAQVGADGGGDGRDLGDGRRGRDSAADEPDVHGGQLEHGADSGGARGAGRRRGERRGDGGPHGERRRLRRQRRDGRGRAGDGVRRRYGRRRG